MKILKTVFVIVSFLTGNLLVMAETSIRDSSSDTQKSNQMGQIINIASGGLNLYKSKEEFVKCAHKCGSCCAWGAAYLAMGMANLAQASAQGKTAGQAYGTLTQTDIGISGGYDPNLVKAIAKDPEIKQGIDFGNAMTNADPAKGMSWDPKTNTVTTASGKAYKSSDFNSPASMAAAGMSKSSIDAITGMSKEIENKVAEKVAKLGIDKKIAVNGSEEGGSGGGGSGSGSSYGQGDADANALSGLASGAASKLGVDRDPAQVAGMQKDYNGEPIGVAGDSIFLMMTRRYKVKESQSTFLDDAALIQK